jgi:hypothetical protein
MLKIKVQMSSDKTSKSEDVYIDISREELKQIACNNAREKFGDEFNRMWSTNEIYIEYPKN